MGASKHFQCTTCGKCCYGSIPLTYKDALTFAGLFPLCLVWTPVQKGSKDFKRVSQLGMTFQFPDGRELASLIVPTAYLPSSYPCPALVDQKICSIHEQKPIRCKTMPFYPYREERFQGEVLEPREGWECDISSQAPLVYDGKKVIQREHFEAEAKDLLEQVPLLRRYAEYMLKYYPLLPNSLWAATTQGKGGQVLTSLSSFLTATKYPDSKGIAGKQVGVLEDYVAKTAKDAKWNEYHKHYLGWAKEMASMASIATTASVAIMG